MTDHRDFAKAHAAAFNARTMESFSKVLEQHSSAVVEFACAMQARVDKAEGLLVELGRCACVDEHGNSKTAHMQVPHDLVAQIRSLLAEVRSRDN